MQDQPRTFLHKVLLADAGISGAAGLLMIAGAEMMQDLLGLPAVLLRGAGLVLIPYVAFVTVVAMRATLSRPAVWTIVACNAAWAVASVLLLVPGWVAPTAIGVAFVLAQAAAVAALGELQVIGLRREEAVAA
jgi:hypothetical protein